MYEPPLHRQDDLAAIHALIRAKPLGLLISHGTQGLIANAIPFLFDADVGRHGRLRCHVARANPQWRDLAPGVDVLVAFQGEDHYISPSWYETKRETGKVVPTWNYLMVQARGAPHVIENADWLQAQIEALTAAHEGGRAKPWAPSDAPADYIAQQKRAIVGIEITINALHGKWKTSQNRPPADRAGVVEGLSADGDADALAMAEVVKGFL